MSKNEGKELMVPITATAIELYEGGVLDAVLTEIEKKARVLVPDASTKKGRDAIRSNASLVTGSKTYLFGLGKDLTEEHRAKVTSINAVRNKMEERLNDLKDEVRKPLTEYETAEKARAAKAQETIDELKGACAFEHASKTAECLRDRLKEIEAIVIDDSFGELENTASIEKEKCINRLQEMVAGAEKREADEAELERLRAESADREAKERQEREEKERIDREEQIRKDAAADAQREAVAKQDRIDRDRAEKVEQDRLDQERKDKAANDREAQLIKDKEDADRRTEMAALAERQRIEREQEAERVAAQKREADTKHRGKINTAAVKSIMKASGITEAQAKEVVKAIATGSVPNVTIQY